MQIIEQTIVKNINIIPIIVMIIIGFSSIIFLDILTSKHWKKYKEMVYDKENDSTSKTVVHFEQYHYTKFKFYKKLTAISYIFIVVLVLLTTALCGTVFGIPQEGKYHYTAKLDDSISINEIYENYEDISYLGNGVYKFKDKTSK